MTKVVVNICHGGFSLSAEAKREYLRRTGRTWTEHGEGALTSFFGPSFKVDGDPHWSDRNLERTDPILIAIVEEMGDKANGGCAALDVQEIFEGTLYRIGEYDGLEWIETRDEIAWSEA